MLKNEPADCEVRTGHCSVLQQQNDLEPIIGGQRLIEEALLRACREDVAA